jgi:xanthine dehydrogenase accessory factor
LPPGRPGGKLGIMASSHPHDHDHDHEHDPTCAVAHGQEATAAVAAAAADKVLVAVFASHVARYLLQYAADAGYHAVLIEPDPVRAEAARAFGAELADSLDAFAPGAADVVVTDHHREELGVQLRDALAAKARWVGIMGNPRHEGPHLKALADLGVPAEEVGRVHRPIGLNIGSRRPAEIAIATLAGLIADRNGKPGGFAF